jgi:Predicted membrane protein
MSKLDKSWNDDQMRDIMGTLLLVGVLASAFFVVLGGILFLIQHPFESADYSTFKGEPARLRNVHNIVMDAINFRSRAVIQLGLLLLIATPVVRVIFSLIGFLFEKDWIYVIITFVVLIILFISLFGN